MKGIAIDDRLLHEVSMLTVPYQKGTLVADFGCTRESSLGHRLPWVVSEGFFPQRCLWGLGIHNT